MSHEKRMTLCTFIIRLFLKLFTEASSYMNIAVINKLDVFQASMITSHAVNTVATNHLQQGILLTDRPHVSILSSPKKEIEIG